MVYNMEFGGESRYYDMDIYDLFKITISRVQKIEPEIAVNLIGCICLKGPAEMVQLAFGSDNFLLSKITDAKNMLGMLSPNNSISDIQIGSYPPSGSHASSCQNNFAIPTPYWDPRLQLDQHPPSHNYDLVARPYADFVGSSLHNQPQPVEQLENTNRMNSYYYQDAESASRINRRSHSLSDLPPKTCHYFNKGFCKHGINCRFSHAQSFPDGYSNVFSPNMTEYANEEHPFTPTELEDLEVELVELLRSKRGMPVSIASLPMLYSERYGKSLQADGYLTESQRHGKTGYNLTRLLSHLNKSIRLIERPHGQHSVILAEDAPRYMECRNERNDLPSNVSSSHQIYLTFPADSTFTEDDVSNYFKQYGQVRDVRLPSLDRRMYGFVSFLHPETVNMILEQRNPHYICGARVLVKPYKEKSKNFDRSHADNSRPMSTYHSRNPDMDPEAHSVTQGCVERARQYKSHFIEREMERERMRLSRLNLVPATPPTQQNYLTHGMEGPGSLLSHLNYGFDFLNDGSEDKAREIRSSYSDQESGLIELPDSPFAGSSIPAAL